MKSFTYEAYIAKIKFMAKDNWRVVSTLPYTYRNFNEGGRPFGAQAQEVIITFERDVVEAAEKQEWDPFAPPTHDARGQPLPARGRLGWGS